LLFAIGLFPLGFKRVNLHLDSSSDWAVMRFSRARIALCRGIKPDYPGLRCLPDALLLNQPPGRRASISLTLYLYDLPRRVEITTEKGDLGDLFLKFTAGGREVILENRLHGNTFNRKVFNLEIPARDVEAAGRYQLPPGVYSFYYPWYGNPRGPSGRWFHWDLCGHDPDRGDLASSHTPVLGAYDSRDPEVVARHIEWAVSAGLDGFILACFGPSSPSWKGIRAFVDVAETQGFRYALSFPFPDYPGEISPLEGAEVIKGALEEFYGPLYIRIEGKPVVFFYAAHQLPRGFWRVLFSELARQGIEVFPVGNFLDPSYGDLFEALYFYLPLFFAGTELRMEFFRWAMALGILTGKPYFYPVFPGFDNRRACGGRVYIPRRRGRTAEDLLGPILALRPQWLLASTFNEWHEGTEFEPSLQFGDFYLRILGLISRQFKENEPIRR